MRTILSLFILLISLRLQAEGVRAISSQLSSMTSIQSTTKTTSDLRIDLNGDGVLDAMRIEQGNVSTEVFPRGDAQDFIINKRDKGEDTIVIGSIKDNKASVSSYFTVKNSDYVDPKNQNSEKNAICDEITDSLKNLGTKDLSSFTRTQIKKMAPSSFDDSCLEYMDPGIGTADLGNYYFSLIRESGNKTCIEKLANEAVVAYKNKQISEIEMLKYQLAFAKAKSDTVDLLEGKGKQPQFICEKSSEKKIEVQNDGSVKIKASEVIDQKLSEQALMKKWGVPGDLTDLQNKCAADKSAFAGRVITSSSKILAANLANARSYGGGAALTSTAFKESVNAASKEEVAAVNATLAQTKVVLPSPTEASPQALAKIQATQGDAAVQQVMARQSSGIMTMTNAVMSAVNTQAVAASGSKSGSSRSVASTKSDTSLSSTSNKTRSSIGGLKNTNIGKDEQIVEEILVGGNNTRTANTARRAGTQVLNNGAVISRAPANADGAETNDASATGGTNPELGGAGRASGGGGGGSASSGGGRGGKKSGGGGGQAANAAGNTRSPASASSSDSAPENVSSDEIVSFIKNSDYQSTKSKLQDYKFQNRLKSNSITIIDRSGNSIGAAEGKIIFVDKGNRFEKQ